MFDNDKMYAGKWQLIKTEPFSKEDKERVERAYVTNSQYGLSVCFVMKTGGLFFKSIAEGCVAKAGDPVDMDKALLLTLAKQGCANIHKIQLPAPETNAASDEPNF